MARNGSKVVVQWMLLTMFSLMALMGSTGAVVICNIDTKNFAVCLPALKGKSPDENCCALIHRVDLPCLCGYKDALRAIGVEPSRAVELPQKCGMKTPRECQVA